MIVVLVFVFGLVIGSFLNVLIDRVPKNKSILGRSFCDNCKKNITWYDLIPVLSFIFLKRKCRNCKSKLSLQYPLVELITGIFFVLIWFKSFALGYYLSFFYWLIVFSILIVLFVSDLKYFIIPDKILFFGTLITLIYLLVSGSGGTSSGLKDSLFGALFFAGIFLLLFLISSGRWLGFGDVKLGAWIGLVAGFSFSVSIFYFAFLTGAMVGISMVFFKKASLKTEIPLGTFITTSAAFVFLTAFNILRILID